MGLSDNEQQRVANMMNCKIGSLPLIYLGIPILDCHLGVKALSAVPDKMRKRLQPWKGKTLTSGGRLILTNTSLSSLPIYTMGVYRLQEGVHQQMDSIRANFFWQGTSEKFKYHMTRWDNMCLPKEYGGLGIIETRTMNESLLGKWGWRILKSRKGDMCAELLRKKYLARKSFMQASGDGGSQFWKGVLSIRGNLVWGLPGAVGNGQTIRFWDDVWVGEIPLKLEF